MHYFSFEISNAPDWCEDVRRCRTGLNPHFLFVLPKRLPGFPAELYRFGTEKPGGYSLLKRECPPRPPKEKRGGISISPRTPLKRHKGAGCGPPLWKPFLGEGGGPRLWKPLLGMGSGSGKMSRGCPICTLRFDATISTAYKAGQALHPARDLVRNSSPAQQFSQNPFPPNLHLCASLEQTLFLFHRARRIFFLAFQKENGGCIPAGKACIPAAVRRIPCGAQSLRKQKRWGFNSAWYHHAFPCRKAAHPYTIWYHKTETFAER